MRSILDNRCAGCGDDSKVKIITGLVLVGTFVPIQAVLSPSAVSASETDAHLESALQDLHVSQNVRVLLS